MSPGRAALPLLGLLALLVATPAFAEKKPLVAGERIDLNTASTAELMRLPGVGKKKAESIVAAREKRPFRKPEEITRVKGLGAKWFARAKGFLTVGEGAPVAAASAPAAAGKASPAAAQAPAR